MRTKLYLARTGALEDPARFARLLKTLPDARREKVRAIRSEAARRLSLGAGLLLTIALAEEGLRPGEICLSAHGKPYLPARADFHFNLSHSGDRVLCAVSPLPVGCDIEGPHPYHPGLAERFFHPDEKAWLFSLPADAQPEAFLRLWVCKESFVKALGLGLSLPLDSFAVRPDAPIGLKQTADARLWRLREFRDGDYVFALCALEGTEDAPVQRVDFSRM